jgi:signal peptidase I
MAKESPSQNLVRIFLREYVEAFLIAIAVGLLLRFFVITPYRVSDLSMYPSLQPGDFAFGYRLAFGARLPFSGPKLGAVQEPGRGQIVSFQNPNHPNDAFVRRVIGLPGDHVEMKKGRLYLNGVAATYRQTASGGEMIRGQLTPGILIESVGGESWSILNGEGYPLTFEPIVVPPHSVFVLSDMRNAKSEGEDQVTQTAYYVVPYNLLEARLVLIWFSLSSPKVGPSPGARSIQWNRILSTIH